MKLYQIIKTTALKYVAPVALGAALYGCSGEPSIPNAGFDLPVFEETRQAVKAEASQHLSALIDAYNKKADEATKSFNRSLQDGKLTLKEQEWLYKVLNSVESEKAKVADYIARSGQDTSFEEKRTVSNLFDLLDKNLNGIDFGVPELEEKLRRNGAHVEVEKKSTLTEIPLVTIGALIGIFTLIGSATYRYNRS